MTDTEWLYRARLAYEAKIAREAVRSRISERIFRTFAPIVGVVEAARLAADTFGEAQAETHPATQGG